MCVCVLRFFTISQSCFWMWDFRNLTVFSYRWSRDSNSSPKKLPRHCFQKPSEDWNASGHSTSLVSSARIITTCLFLNPMQTYVKYVFQNSYPTPHLPCSLVRHPSLGFIPSQEETALLQFHLTFVRKNFVNHLDTVPTPSGFHHLDRPIWIHLTEVQNIASPSTTTSSLLGSKLPRSLNTLSSLSNSGVILCLR